MRALQATFALKYVRNSHANKLKPISNANRNSIDHFKQLKTFEEHIFKVYLNTQMNPYPPKI